MPSVTESCGEAAWNIENGSYVIWKIIEEALFVRDQTRREVKGGGEQEAETKDSIIILKCYSRGTLGDGSIE
jgi:hypothetical protein